MIVVRVAVPVVIGKRSELSDPARETDTDVENRGIDIAAGDTRHPIQIQDQTPIIGIRNESRVRK